MDGALYVVAGTGLYSVSTLGSETLLGSIPGSDYVRMSDNAGYLIIQTGNSAYVYSSGTLIDVTALMPSIPRDVTFLKQRSVFVGSGGTFFVSDLGDPLNYQATNIATAESSEDDLVACTEVHDELYLIGTKTIEIWYTTGNPDFPLSSIDRSRIDRGCAAKHSVQVESGSLFWLGDDRVVYSTSQYQVNKLSNSGMDRKIQDYDTISDAVGVIYPHDGRKFYALTFPSENATWELDLLTGLWHERQTRLSSTETRHWLATSYAEVYGRRLVGSAFSGDIYQISADTFTEGAYTMIATASGPPIHAERKRAFMHDFELDIESGVGLVTGQGSAPVALLDYSNDGGHTWVGERELSMGALGQRNTRVRTTRLGRFRERIMRVRISDPVFRALLSASATIDQEV